MLSMLPDAFDRDLGEFDVPLPTAKTPAPRPLDEARRSPIDRIERTASATIVRRIVRHERTRDRSDVTPFTSGI
ncbi:hypothetical protein Abr02nite_30780 [Paractinoplanes brasiliensis]|nr:hypothetical protein Abr02nite_30780 [Actinoplanes brasiliensis]